MNRWRFGLLGLLLLGGCERLSEIGRAPALAAVQNPTTAEGYQPVTMPMPTPSMPVPGGNSLWRPGSRTFLRDQRAASVGDLVTILVSIQDTAELANNTARNRTGTDTLGLPRLFGLESSLTRFLPNSIDPTALVQTNGAQASNGTGTVKRNETINLRLAATVTQLLPNGNLVVSGHQQVRVNSELRDLQVGGVIRPQDIASDNTVKHDRLAEARISYGGRGSLSELQAPRYGQQILDAVLPF